MFYIPQTETLCYTLFTGVHSWLILCYIVKFMSFLSIVMILLFYLFLLLFLAILISMPLLERLLSLTI